MGYFLASAKFNVTEEKRFYLKGIILPCLMHGFLIFCLQFNWLFIMLFYLSFRCSSFGIGGMMSDCFMFIFIKGAILNIHYPEK